MSPRLPHPRIRAAATLAALSTLAALGVATASPASAATVVGQNFVLGPGQVLTSAANGYRLAMNTDGNLVLYTDHSVALWTSGTAGRGASSLNLQGDGNLVVRTTAGAATWASGARGTTLSVQDDGNVVLRSGARAVWCTCAVPFLRVVGHPAGLARGQGMLGGDSLVAGRPTLTLQTDGNLVLRNAADAATWVTNTRGGSGSTLAMQTDGNLVLRAADKRAVWASGTAGRGVTTLRLGSDGSLQLVTAAGTPAWAVGTGATPTGIAADVFALLNRQRAANGLPALSSDPRLIVSATRHNATMSAADQLSHQLPGEAYFADRITAAGYVWSQCAENIAYTTNATSAGAQAMQTAMYDETPPNDGHRRNILSPSLRQVGVSVLVDARGKLWLTTDFGTPR